MAPLDPVAASLVAAQEAYASGALGEAHDRLRAALDLAPSEPSVRQWLGRVLNDLGHFDQALGVLAPALEALPQSAWLLVERSRAERGLARFDQAQSDLRAALTVYPSLDTARLELVGLLIQLGPPHAAEALAELQPLMERQPTRPGVILRRAEALGLLGREPEAESVLREQVGQPRVALALCRWLAERERIPEAWEVGASLVEQVQDPAGRVLLAQVAQRAGEPLVALQLLASMLTEDAQQPLALSELAVLLHDVEPLRTALAERRIAAEPGDAQAWIGLCEDRLRAGDFEGLLARCDGLPASLCGDPRFVLLRGQALRHLGRVPEARACLEPLANQGVARASYELGLIDYAGQAFHKAAQRFEQGASGTWAADAHFNRGVCLDRLEDFAGAAQAYRAATQARPGFAEAWLQLGNDLRLRLGQADEARNAYRRFLELGGDDPEVRRFVGSRP